MLTSQSAVSGPRTSDEDLHERRGGSHRESSGCAGPCTRPLTFGHLSLEPVREAALPVCLQQRA